MQARQLLTALVIAALLAGCAPDAGTPPSPSSSAPTTTGPARTAEGLVGQDPDPARGDPLSGDPAGSGPNGGVTSDAPPEPREFPVSPAPDVLQRQIYHSTREIPGPGLYLVDLTTGEVEAWQSEKQTYVDLSDDRRWVVTQGESQVYWANRETGKTYTWNPQELRLLASDANRFLFTEVRTGRFYVTDESFQVVQRFTLDMPVGKAQFAPGGGSIALTSGAWPTDGKLYLVDTETGASRDLGPPPTAANGQLAGVELLGPITDELMVSYVIGVVEPSGLTRESSIIRRYSWNGEVLGEFTAAGRAAHISPDRRLLASAQNLYHLDEAAVVTDLSTGQPLFRVTGTAPAAWMADSRGLVLESRLLTPYLVSLDGDLRDGPTPPRSTHFIFLDRLRPSPDEPGQFLYGLAVMNESGQVLQRVDLPDGDGWLIRDPDWGADGREVVIRITPPSGKGLLGFEAPLHPAVQKPPFPDPYLLLVQDPQGECLNLRESYSRSSRVIRCLPTGTRLAVADLFQAPVKLNEAFYYDDDQFWLWARTEQGETGWVSLSTGSVVWGN